uniref:Uncharacterized protein n=1 Tax=Cordyceps militaris TaxID=73501 RepID=A0A0G3Y6W4_CORMI|nr:hypothetical protein [Cordyceps militaris]AKM22560.1 hypothetical protein [Cordyceps militaris]AKM22571.1 hypothetical protein [Cordyceps militaris]AKM22632.1 hypothetical protein [Cordyceps militaris]AKM22648.1 hypothetical protein [Cordyceps militaris]
MRKQNLMQRFITGAKKGIFTPTLPNNILKIHNNFITRIFRILGGISILLILTHRLEYLGEGLLYPTALVLCTVLALFFGLYLIFITYHRFKYIIKILKSDELDIRNSL